jgi:hypothetical protein
MKWEVPKMPMGLVIMHWDERVGVEVVAAYPSEAQIQEKTLMQLYSQHEFTGEAGMVSLMAGATNLASYYTGPDTGVYVVMILSSDEDGDAYEEGLAEISRQIIMNLDSSALTTLLPSLFQRLSVYPTLNYEQKLAMLLHSDVKRMLLNRLREDSVITKSEIAIWLKDQYKDGFVDIESIVGGMVKAGVVKISSVKGLASDVVFLVEDIMMLRRPPVELLKNPEEHHLPASLKESYITEVKNFFLNYKPDPKDSLEIIDKVLLDPQNYEVLKLMREAMVTRMDLEKLKKKGVDDVDKVLKTFWEVKMIAVFQDDKGTEYYCLTSDFYINRFYPRYNLDTIRAQYRNKAQNPSALMKALDLMKDEYNLMKKAAKEQAQASEKAEA